MFQGFVTSKVCSRHLNHSLNVGLLMVADVLSFCLLRPRPTSLKTAGTPLEVFGKEYNLHSKKPSVSN